MWSNGAAWAGRLPDGCMGGRNFKRWVVEPNTCHSAALRPALPHSGVCQLIWLPDPSPRPMSWPPRRKREHSCGRKFLQNNYFRRSTMINPSSPFTARLTTATVLFFRRTFSYYTVPHDDGAYSCYVCSFSRSAVGRSTLPDHRRYLHEWIHVDWFSIYICMKRNLQVD